MEPTGAETSSANGKAERSIGIAGVTTQLLRGMTNLEVIFWCFALLHGVILLNVRPHSESGISPFEALFKKMPNLTSLRIFGSTMYKVDRCLTRRRPDSATRACVWLDLHGTQAVCNYMDQVTKSLGYAHHYVVDELDTATLPGDHGLAAKVLSGLTTDGPISDLLREDILSLEPDVSPWLSDTLVNHFVPAIPPGHHFGFSTFDDKNFTRVKILALIPGSFATTHLADKNIINMYLLAINGIPIHTASDISDVIDDLMDRKPDQAHNLLSGFNFLFGSLTDEDQYDELYLQVPDHATSRVVMTIALLDQDSTLDGVTMRSCDQFPEYFHIVASIHPDLMEKCPTSFGKAMQDPIHRAQWRESLFGHLASCYSMGTYGCPTIPPPGATILPAVIVLKLVLTQLKQAAVRKTRVCVNGSVQIQGRDYEESYTPTLLAPSTKILIAVTCYLN
jgi:hypothetical protein